MEKNEILQEILDNLPTNSKITYVQQITPRMNVPYKLTVKGYKKFYLNTTSLADLTPKEQLILLNSNDGDPTHTPSRTIAAIFKARKISERSQNSLEAIGKCNSVLVEENQEWLNARGEIARQISKKKAKAAKLEHYLEVEKALAKYHKQQNSRLSFVRNFGNTILEKITRKPRTTPPYDEDELEEGKKAWEQFRQEQEASATTSNRALLKQYKYNSSIATREPFEFMYDTPEINALAEEYATTIIALQILDGSAYKKAERVIMKNPFQYLKRLKAHEQQEQSK